MRKQRHNWLHYLVIFSLVVLPLQYSGAMEMQTAMSMSQKHDCMEKQATSGHTCHHKCHQADATSTMQNNCDSVQDCCQHHQYGKYQYGVLSIETGTGYTSHNLPTRFIDTFSQFISNPDPRPPKV